MFTLVYGQQFPKVGKLLVYQQDLETVVHTQEKTEAEEGKSCANIEFLIFLNKMLVYFHELKASK